jgi:cytochrome c oxidase cbb3-type subunit 2
MKMQVLRRLGHPYSDEEIAAAPAALEGLSEADALVAYLQMLGTSIPAGDAH